MPVADGSPLPLAAARNLGARCAAERVGADTMIFLDVDCIPAPGLVDDYRSLAADDGPDGGNRVSSGPVGYLPPTDSIRNWTI